MYNPNMYPVKSYDQVYGAQQAQQPQQTQQAQPVQQAQPQDRKRFAPWTRAINRDI